MRFIFLYILTFTISYSYSQKDLIFHSNYKTIEDDDIEVGDTIVADFRYSTPCTTLEIIVDTLEYENINAVYFFKKNDQFIYDIHTNTDARGSAEFNLKFSNRRAQEIRDELIRFGVDSSVFRNVYGHGESQPIIKEDEIRAMETEAEQEAAHQMNRRTYFVVVELRED